MAKMMNMMKQVKELRKMQKQLNSKSFEIKSPDGLITVVSRGDMSVKSVTVSEEALEKFKLEKLNKVLTSTVNSALDSAKKAAAKDMSEMTGGLGGMLGG